MPHEIKCSYNKATCCSIMSAVNGEKTAGWYCGKNHYEVLRDTGMEYRYAQISNKKPWDKPWENQTPGKYHWPLCKDNYTNASQ